MNVLLPKVKAYQIQQQFQIFNLLVYTNLRIVTELAQGQTFEQAGGDYKSERMYWYNLVFNGANFTLNSSLIYSYLSESRARMIMSTEQSGVCSQKYL